jgi:N,N'-diacetyllegionaminate synthase
MVEIISEIGQNFNGDLDLAILLIREAKKCGADVAKFQWFNVQLCYPLESPWYTHATKCQLSMKQVKVLMEECDRTGIEFMTSVFDENRVTWCEELGVKRYKIACRSFFDKPLLDAVEATGKEVIQSVPYNLHIPKHRRKNFKYLYCVNKYPARPEEVDILNVDFTEYDGFSDHTIGTAVPIQAMQQGASIIEKHFTLDKKAEGPDHKCSMTPDELECLVRYRAITGGA